MKKLVLLTFCNLFFTFASYRSANAQTICPDPIPPSVNDMPPGCTICEFPITGTTTGYTAGPLQNGNYGCGFLTIQNEQYIVFIANQPCVSFTIDAFNCTSGPDGLQGFIFDLGMTQAYDCTQGCGGGSNPPPFVVNTCGLTPGQAYFLIIDGCSGAICQFTVNATGTQGGDFVTLGPMPSPLCAGDNINIQIPHNPPGGVWSGPVSSNGVFNPSVLGPGTYTVNYSFTNQWGCSDDENITFTINPSPVVTLNPAGPFCQNDPAVTLTFSPPGGTWTGPVGPGGVFNPASAGPGTHSITYTVNNGGCSDDETISITVNPLPVINITPVPPMCQGGPPVNVTANPPGGTWTGSVGPGGVIDPSMLGPGTYMGTYTVTDGNGCTNSANLSFTINPAPMVTINPAGPFCANGNSVSLSASPPGGTWGGAAPGGSFNPGSLGPGTHQVTYTFTNGQGCSDMDMIDIVVNPAPMVDITPAGPFCQTDPPVTINASPPGGTFTGPIAGNGTFNPATAGPGSHTITYTYTNSFGCTDDAMITIVVNPQPNVMITPVPPLCTNGNPVTLNGSPPGGTWGGAASGGSFNPAIGPGTYVVTYSVTNANGCSDDDMITITVNPAPTVDITPVGPFCETANPVNVSATPPGGIWTGPISPGGVFNPSSTGPGNWTVTYTYTDANGCMDQENLTIVVLPNPDPTIFSPGDLCIDGPPVTLSANPPGGTWGGVAAPAGVIDPSVLGSGTFQVTYSVTDANGCMGMTDLSITIRPLPNVMILPPPVACENGPPFSLNGTPAGGIWSGDVNPNGTVDPSALGPGTFNATYEYTDGFGCMNSASTTFMINPAPVVTIDPAGPFCENGPSVTLTATPPGGIWGGGSVSGTGVFNPSQAGPGTYFVNYTYTNSFGCTEDDEILIDVIDIPDIFLLSPDEYCENDPPVTLDANPGGGTWGGVASPSGVITPTVLGPGIFQVLYYYQDFTGCRDTADFTIRIFPKPNVSIIPDGPFCENENPVILRGIPIGGIWGGAANFIGEIDPQQLGPGTFEVTYEYTDGNNCSDMTTMQITILPAPDPFIQPLNILCVESGIQTLIATPPGGSWSGAANAQGRVDPAQLGPGFHIATYFFSNANGCSSFYDLEIEVSEPPEIFFPYSGPFCPDDELLYFDVVPFGGTWDGDVNEFGEFNPAVLGPGWYTAVYSYTDFNGCFNMDSTDFLIYDPIDIEILSDTLYCESDGPVTLQASPARGTWTGSIINSSGLINPSTTTPGVYPVTYTYVQQPGACVYSKVFNIRISGPPTISIQGDTLFCRTAGQQTFTALPAGGIWGGVANANGQLNPDTLSVGNHFVTYTVTYAGTCQEVFSRRITVTAPPTAVLQGTGTICPGGNSTADLQVTLTGNAPWRIEFMLDTVRQAPVIASSSPFTLTVGTAGTYRLLTVRDAGGCVNTASGTGIVVEITPLAVENLNTDCDINGANYVLTFEITGGDPATYAVNGVTGTISATAPYIFTSQPVPTGQGFRYTVSDNSGCAPVSDSIIVDCSCVTEVGTMTGPTINECGAATVTALYDTLGQFLDLDDLLQFVLHTNSGVSLGTVLATNNTPTFSFNPVTMQYGRTYYISAIVGSNDGMGNVNINDNCLQVAAGTPVIFREIPSAILSGDNAICLGDTTSLSFLFTGQSPWSLTYWDGVDSVSLNGVSTNPYTVEVNPATTTTFEIIRFRNNFCPGTASGQPRIVVNRSPQITDVRVECNGTFTQYSVSFTITGGDPATYSVSGNTGTLVGNVFTSDLIPSGTGYQFSVTDANGCDPAVISNPIVVCDCFTKVGTMDGATIRICGDGPAQGIYDPTLEALDADDIVRFVLHTGGSGNTLGTILNTNTQPVFSFDPLTMTYGTTYYITAVAGSNDGSGNINFADPCLVISNSTPVVFRVIPTALLANDLVICQGQNARLSVDLTGQSPWTLVYNNGTTDVTINANTSPWEIVVSPTLTTSYTLVSIRDAFCTGNVTGSVRVTVNTPPQVRNVEIECNTDKTFYIVRFEITGGDPGTYSVNGDPGTLTGNRFVSDPIPAGLGYSFTVRDANNCGDIPVNAPTVECECETEAGTLQPGPLTACENETITAFHNNDEFLDINDTLLFYLHDGTPAALGNIIMVNNTPVFTYDPVLLQTDTRYYIVAIAGNKDGNGGILFTDHCLSMSNAVEILFHPLPTAILTGDATICRGESTTLNLQFTGTAPFSVTFSDGRTLNNLPANHNFTENPTLTTSFSIVSVRDQFCSNTANSSVIVTVNDPPTAVVAPTGTICNTDENGDPTTLDFSTFVTGGDRTGTWEAVDIVATQGTLPLLDFNGAAPGQYRFRYTTGSALPPCVNVSYVLTVTVRDCSCPSVATTAPAPMCNNSATLDLNILKVTTEAGSWRIVSAPAGSTATIAGNLFNGTNSTAGNYVVEFKLNQAPAGCLDFSTQTIVLSAALSAGTAGNPLVLCNDGSRPTVNLYDLLSGESAGGTWAETSTTPSGGFSAATGTLTLSGVAPGIYTFRYSVDAVDPCPDDSESVIVQIERPLTAGQVIRNPQLCAGVDSVYNLFNLIRNYDTGGSWSEVSAVPSSAGAFNAQAGTFNTSGQVAGTYRFRYFTDAVNPCTDDEEFVVVTISANPLADAGAVQELTCNVRRVIIGGNGSSTGPNIRYQWTGNVSDPNILNPEVTEGGIYTLTVIDNTSGCRSTDAVEIRQNENFPTLTANSIDITCFGDNDGTVRVNNVVGGVPPFLYSLNGSAFSNKTLFDNLSPGNYSLEVEDANGCRDRVTFTISEPDELTVTLTVNLDNNSNVITEGDSVLLIANVTGPFDTVIWTPAEAFGPCDPEGMVDCLERWVRPQTVTTYRVVALNQNGCSDNDELTLYVKKDRGVYIPSAFSPNDDLINDKFRIYAGAQVAKVRSFLVFDRWGEVVYEYYDFDPNDPAYGWDGRLREKPMNAAVFAYFAEIEFKDGYVELYKGDVTLVK